MIIPQVYSNPRSGYMLIEPHWELGSLQRDLSIIVVIGLLFVDLTKLENFSIHLIVLIFITKEFNLVEVYCSITRRLWINGGGVEEGSQDRMAKRDLSW